MRRKKIAYIAHSLMGGENSDIKENFKTNRLKIKRICDEMIRRIKIEEKMDHSIEGIHWTPFPFAPQLYFPDLVNESEASEEEFPIMRKIAIDFCMTILSRCDEVHVYNYEELSSGVRDDIEEASKLGIPVYFKKHP